MADLYYGGNVCNYSDIVLVNSGKKLRSLQTNIRTIYSKRKCALLLHVFAGYLSWMRNTYIMTLAGVAMINSEVAPLSPVAGSGKADNKLFLVCCAPTYPPQTGPTPQKIIAFPKNFSFL